eukprot:Platyproteum_vivax@DN7477_c2_g4_i3.p1
MIHSRIASLVYDIFSRTVYKRESVGDTFVIFVGQPATIWDTAKWVHIQGYGDKAIYEYDGEYHGTFAVAISYEPSNTINHLEKENCQKIVQEITDKLKTAKLYNYKVLAQFAEEGGKLQKDSKVANRLRTNGKFVKIASDAKVTDEWAVLNLHQELWPVHAAQKMVHFLYAFPFDSSWIASMVKKVFVQNMYGMNGGLEEETYDMNRYVDVENPKQSLGKIPDSATTKEEKNKKIKELNENLAKPEYASFKTPASIEMMEKLQKVNRPVATQHLMVDSELQDMSKRKVVDQVEPREEPQEFFEPPDDIPEEFDYETRNWALQHPLSASDMAKNPTPLNYIKIGKVAKALDKEDKSPKRRQVVFDEIEGQFVMKLVENTPLKMEDYKINNWEAKQ